MTYILSTESEKKSENQGELLLQRDYCNTTYKFYVKSDGSLAVNLIRDNKTISCKFINGLPGAFFPKYLTGPEGKGRREQLKDFLKKHCFFDGLLVETLIVRVRGPGGFDPDLHDGHLYGTVSWAEGFGFTQEQSTAIGKACTGVDSAPDTNPNSAARIAQQKTETPVLDWAHSWHFNMGTGEEGSKDDTRMQHAAENLSDAITLFENRDEYLTCLGKGLHPLQDSFAHTLAEEGSSTRGFVIKFNILGVSVGSHLTYLKDADDVRYVDDQVSFLSSDPDEAAEGFNDRYSAAKTATSLYFLLFKICTDSSLTEGEKQNYLDQFQARCETILPRWKKNLMGFLGAFFDANEQVSKDFPSLRGDIAKIIHYTPETDDVLPSGAKQESLVKRGGSLNKGIKGIILGVFDLVISDDPGKLKQYVTQLNGEFIEPSEHASATSEKINEMQEKSLIAIALLDWKSKFNQTPDDGLKAELYNLYRKVGIFLTDISWGRDAVSCLKMAKEIYRDSPDIGSAGEHEAIDSCLGAHESVRVAEEAARAKAEAAAPAGFFFGGRTAAEEPGQLPSAAAALAHP